MNIKKTTKIYEGKAKIIYNTNDEDYLIQYFKDDATAFNAQKKSSINNKGILNNKISEILMKHITNNSDVPCHFIERIDERHQIIKKLDIIELEIIIRNYSAGSLAKRLNIKEGVKFDNVVFELCYKNDALNDPLINDDHAINVLNLLSKSELDQIKKYSFQINKILSDIFILTNIKLVDFKIEFGRDKYNNIILADEISPDSCRLWDITSNKKLDKDIFRQDLGDLASAYEEVLKRLS
ncbi:MAG: phosphoribosylaminoimidazolesuccinocarboxamide synthase [Rickettsiales bacterium]|jgi:phosphoribosylaminoimidazole-succinocarboxamide synthase|nr:phosphoribosylaminoimidazolesuccinocarboxamide synthase [Rickettsiales bacterium]|tara:strand:- start:7920 stop:8636 length:717 start_codon:yes stop_codon:yes gene_type:complete